MNDPMGRLSTLAVLTFLLVFLPACDRKNPVSEYGDRMMGARQSARDAAVKANLDAVQKSVEAYRAANGEFPRELNDVGSMLGGQVDLSQYDYNPRSGVVSLRK